MRYALLAVGVDLAVAEMCCVMWCVLLDGCCMRLLFARCLLFVACCVLLDACCVLCVIAVV